MNSKRLTKYLLFMLNFTAMSMFVNPAMAQTEVRCVQKNYTDGSTGYLTEPNIPGSKEGVHLGFVSAEEGCHIPVDAGNVIGYIDHEGSFVEYNPRNPKPRTTGAFDFVSPSTVKIVTDKATGNDFYSVSSNTTLIFE